MSLQVDRPRLLSERWLWLAPTVLFIALALRVTWPLVLHLTTSVPGDDGDPLFAQWVMGWVASRLAAAIGHPASLQSFWDAGIFYPEPDTLAFSEHFIAETVVILPVYWLTQNLILCYNVAFLASFVLTALCTALLARALTGSMIAAMLAGLVASFNPYRLFLEVSHLQTLTFFAFPLVLLAVHRYLATGRRAYLAGAAAAWLGLNLSSVYYLAYAPPFIVAFALVETWRLGQWRKTRVWIDLAVTIAVVVALTVPFLLPYARVQARYGASRTPREIDAHSATLDLYLAALAPLAVPLGLALVSIVGLLVARRMQRRVLPPSSSVALPIALLLMMLSAVWLSFGPVVRLHSQALDVPAAYGALMGLPGYSALRVPLRFASVSLVLLGVLVAIGASVLAQIWPRTGTAIVLGCIAAFIWQGRHQRVPLDRPLASPWLHPPAAYLTAATKLPPIYQAARQLPDTAVLLEMPFGDPGYELRYMTFQIGHRRRLVNGYSGFYPPSYEWRKGALANPRRDLDRAWRALAGATHVIVHKTAWLDETAPGDIERWLTDRGAVVIGEGDQAILFQLPPP